MKKTAIKKWSVALILAVLMLITSACGNATPTPSQALENTPISSVVPTVTPSEAPSPTPTQTPEATATPEPEPPRTPIPDSTPVPPDFTGTVTGSYEFTGKNAHRAGYAEGKITLTPSEDATGRGYYWLFFANEEGILPGYEEITVEKITADAVEIQLLDGMLIPEGATSIEMYRCKYPNYFRAHADAPDAILDIPAEKQFKPQKLELTFASVSDVHMNYGHLNAEEKWTSALNLFTEMGIEYVISSGDMTEDGGYEEYERYVNAITASSFPPENIYEARGNHDSQHNDEFIKYTSGKGEVHPYEGSPYYHVLIEGGEGERDNLFIFMAQYLKDYGSSAQQDNFDDAQLDWLEGLLKQYGGTDTNLFLIEHASLRNFGPGDKYEGAYGQSIMFTDDFKKNQRFKSLLTEYKELVMMSGHTHLSFYDWLNYSDEGGNGPRMIHNSSVAQPRGYTPDGSDISYDNNGKTTDKRGSEGYLVYVYDSDIVYVGYNFSTGEIIPKASFIMEVYSEDRSDVTSIEITKKPDKAVQQNGTFFDARGMEVTATFADGTTSIVRGWTLGDTGPLQTTDTEMVIYYGKDSKVSTTLPITVE